MGQLKLHGTQDLQKIDDKMDYKGDFMTGSKTYRVGKSSSIRCGSIVDLPGVSAVNPLAGLN